MAGGSFTVSEHKTLRFVCLLFVKYVIQSSFTNTTNVNVTAHIKLALTVYIYSFKVKSNKILTYSSVCIVVVHIDVHLSSSVPSFSIYKFLLFPSQYIVV